MECPCRHCENRSVGCHSHCEAYAGYDAERKAIRKEVRQEMEMNTIEVNRYINAAKNRRAAYQRRHKKD